MKNKTRFFVLILFFPFFSFSQKDECRGLNFHSIYSFDQNSVFAEHFSTFDSSSIFLGHIEPKSGIILKISKSGLTAWSKKITVADFLVTLFSGHELKDKNYLLAGLVSDPNRQTPPQILIMKFDTSGIILWKRLLKVNVPKGIVGSLDYIDVQEGLNGNILLVATVGSKTVNTSYLFYLVAQLNNVGNVLMSKLYESGFNMALRIPEQRSNDIEILGNYTFRSPTFPYNRFCAFLYLKIDPSLGSIIDLKSCTVSLSPADVAIWGVLGGLRAGKTNDSLVIYGSVPTNIGSDLQGLVVSFSNSNFSGYRINSSIANSNLYSKFLRIDEENNAGFVMIGGNKDFKMIYASIDASGKIGLQTSTSITSDIWVTNNTIENLLAFKKRGIFSFGFPVTINTKPYIHHFQFDKNGIDQTIVSCLGSDTSDLFSTKPLVITANDFAWDAIYSDILMASIVTVIEQETPLYKEDVCYSKMAPSHPLTLGNDLLLCPGQTIKLQTAYSYQSYEWQDGSKDSIYIVSAPGLYSLKVQDHCDYFYSDNINISYRNSKFEIGNGLSICKGDMALIEPPTNFKDFIWQPSLDVKKINGFFQLSPTITTEYKVEAKDTAGCSFTDSILVQVKDCVNKLFIPTAFTPNSDGKNEIFKPYVQGNISFYRFTIFNRWGSAVFSTTDINRGWDGTINGQSPDTSMFIWICEYQFKGEAKQLKKGSLLLIR